MPSQPLPRTPRLFGEGGFDLQTLRTLLLRLASMLGLATRRPPLATPPPLFPGLKDELAKVSNRLPDVKRVAGTASAAAASTASAMSAVTERIEVVHRPRQLPVEAAPTAEALKRTAIRLAVLSVGAMLGAAGIFALGSILSRPAASNAKSLIHV